VQENPADARGWSMLGRSYTLLGRFGEASEAYAKAETLAPRDADLLSRHAEARIMANNGTVGEDARGLIARALAIDPKDPRARFYQAVGEIQAGREHEALNLLVALEADTPADAAWRPVVTRRIDALASQLGLDPAHLPGRAAPSPATAAPLAPERAPPPGTSGPDQAKMIRGMVEGLAARLEKEPNDPDGWARLGKSYGVLGEREKSRDAWRHAAELKPDDPAILAAYASAMLTAAGDGPAPPEFAATAAQLLRVAPDNPDALWFAGVAAQARGDASAARKYWQSLLDRLPAESPARDEVARALAELK
jgi:cytochrome c-type biogenesis protein CcmH